MSTSMISMEFERDCRVRLGWDGRAPNGRSTMVDMGVKNKEDGSLSMVVGQWRLKLCRTHVAFPIT